MNFQKSIRVVVLLMMVLSLTVASRAQGRRDEGRWQQLGRSYVDGRNDHDRIVVNHNESFRALQLEVRGGAIEFQRVVVHFENGPTTTSRFATESRMGEGRGRLTSPVTVAGSEASSSGIRRAVGARVRT